MDDDRSALEQELLEELTADEPSAQEPSAARALDPRPTPSRTSEAAEVLRIRWDTPRGRKVRTQVVRDVRFEGSAHLADILHELRGSEEVSGFLDLRYARLDGENLNGTHLAGVDLTGASLAKATLVGADLHGARLTKARIVGAALREADLSRADLSDANLTEADLEQASAVSASFVRARCIGASFRRTTLVGADLRGAMLVRASFDDADLGGAQVASAHALGGAFARAAQAPVGLEAVNEVVLGAVTPAPRPPVESRIERTRRGSFVVQQEEAKADPWPAEKPQRTPTPVPAVSTRSWDAALAGLLMQRGRVSRITIVVDGAERVVFER